MDKEQLRELQLLELDILLAIDRVCRDNHITYYLAEGTLIGAIRHHGFIPWDDDVDIMMMRSDYEHFLKAAPAALGNGFFVQHSSRVYPYWSPFIKVRDNRGPAKYIQTHISHLTEINGPCVDIFPLDAVAHESSLAQKWQARFIRYFRSMLSLKLKLYAPKTFKSGLLYCASFFFPVKAIHRILNKLLRLFDIQKCDYIASLASYHPWRTQIAPKSVYDHAIDVDFEGYQFPVPAGYDYLLRRIYGDYMELPPEEKRNAVKHHYVPAGSGKKSEISEDD